MYFSWKSFPESLEVNPYTFEVETQAESNSHCQACLGGTLISKIAIPWRHGSTLFLLFSCFCFVDLSWPPGFIKFAYNLVSGLERQVYCFHYVFFFFSLRNLVVLRGLFVSKKPAGPGKIFFVCQPCFCHTNSESTIPTKPLQALSSQSEWGCRWNWNLASCYSPK